MTKLSRHEIRIKAMQVLFMQDFDEGLSKEQAISDVFDLDENLVSENSLTPAYLDQLVSGVVAHQAEIEAEIGKHLKSGWTVGRLSKVDRIVLSLAIFEIKYINEIPAKVAVNEAIELAKDFGEEQSSNFINGVLKQVINEY